MNNRSGVSVVICTHNGAGRLPKCLDALSKCAFESDGEVIVVDNNSTDDSAAVAASCWATADDAPVPLRVVKEAKQGLTWARRAGAQAAQYELIVYCDDDNLLNPDYVIAAIELMRNPRVGAASGVARPVSCTDFPAWFYTFAEDYTVGCQARWPEEADVDMTPLEQRCPWGAGLVVRRQNLLKAISCPNFPLLVGRNGAILSAGEDYEICHLIALQGKRLVFSPRLKLDHYIPPERLNPEYLARLQAGFVEQTSVLQAYAALRGLLKRKQRKLVLEGFIQLLKDAIRGRTIRHDMFAISVGIDRSLGLNELQRRVFENYKFVRD